jgi:hypothetical protein
MQSRAQRLPVGVQLVAAEGKDHLLRALAAQFESAHPWPELAPLVLTALLSLSRFNREPTEKDGDRGRGR